MDTLKYICDKYKVNKEDKVIPLFISRWSSIPRLFRQLGFTVGAEIGVASGRFSKTLCLDNPALKLYCVDKWEIYPGYTDMESKEKIDRLYRECRVRLAPYKCYIIRDWSMKVVRRFADESLDFVFIDANHDYEHCKEDIREWSKKVRKGGIVFGHDYRNIHREKDFGYEVKQAVDEWVEKQSIKPLFILRKEGHYNCDTWLYIK